jgi:PIN domain nuclease of toxin-antitoxin system
MPVYYPSRICLGGGIWARADVITAEGAWEDLFSLGDAE